MSNSSSKALLLLGVLALAACSSPPQRPGPGTGLSTEPPPAPVMPKPTRPSPLEPAPEPEPAAAGVQDPAAGVAPAIDESVRRDFDRGLALLRESKFVAAISAFEDLHQRHPRLSGPLVNLGIAYAGSGQTEQARAAVRKALQQRETAPAWNQLGLLLRQQGQMQAARQAYEKAIALDPDHAFARLNLGVLCDLYLGDHGCALTQYRAYLQSEPADARQVELWIFDLEQRSNAGGGTR